MKAIVSLALVALVSILATVATMSLLKTEAELTAEAQYLKAHMEAKSKARAAIRALEDLEQSKDRLIGRQTMVNEEKISLRNEKLRKRVEENIKEVQEEVETSYQAAKDYVLSIAD